jgi:hypothetical protein
VTQWTIRFQWVKEIGRLGDKEEVGKHDTDCSNGSGSRVNCTQSRGLSITGTSIVHERMQVLTGQPNALTNANRDNYQTRYSPITKGPYQTAVCAMVERPGGSQGPSQIALYRTLCPAVPEEENGT